MQKNRGFSLIEVIVASGILSVVILGVMRVNDNLISVEQSFMQSQDALEILNNAKLFMGQQASCMGLFSQAKEKRENGLSYIPLEGEVQSLVNFDLTDFLKVGDQYGKLKLTRLSFSPQKGYFEGEQFNHEKGIVDLHIHVEGIGKYARKKVKTLPIWVYSTKEQFKPAYIVYCDSSRADMVSYITESVMARVCVSLEAIYDSSSGNCLFGTDQEKDQAIKNAQKASLSKQRGVSSNKKINESEILNMFIKAMMMEQSSLQNEQK